MKKKKFVPKESVKLSREWINGVWDCAEEKERLKLLEELYRDPLQFLETYFTDDQKEMITKKIVSDWQERKRGHHYFISSTKSGKILAQYGEKDEVLKFTETWIRESPYYDPNDPIIIEKVLVDWDNFGTTKKIIKEY